MKGVDSTYKILLTLMCNDLYMNGMITWKQNTYADKMGITRQSVNKMFNRLIDIDVLIPDSKNKPGSKHNTFQLSIRNIHKLVKNNNGFKTKPVNPSLPTCKPQFTQPVNPGLPTCKPQFTYNKSNKSSNKDLLTEEESVLGASSSSGPTGPSDIELFKFSQELDI